MQMDPKLEAVLTMANQDWTGLKSVKELACLIQISTTQLATLFRTEFGVTPGHYIRKLRIGRALTLLKTDIRVKQVANELVLNCVS